MADTDIAEITTNLKKLVRKNWDHLGCVESENGAFATGHIPHVAPLAYLCKFYPGLSEAEIEEEDQDSSRPIPAAYRCFLSVSNGAHLMKLSLDGVVGLFHRDATNPIGQPFRLHGADEFKYPAYIPKGHYSIGAMNGEYYSQGHLYLTSLGEVELYNSKHDIIGAKWNSFAEFLETEIPRQIALYDQGGRIKEGVKFLPQDTDDWEEIWIVRQ